MRLPSCEGSDGEERQESALGVELCASKGAHRPFLNPLGLLWEAAAASRISSPPFSPQIPSQGLV